MSYPGVGITRIQFDGSNLSLRPCSKLANRTLQPQREEVSTP